MIKLVLALLISTQAHALVCEDAFDNSYARLVHAERTFGLRNTDFDAIEKALAGTGFAAAPYERREMELHAVLNVMKRAGARTDKNVKAVTDTLAMFHRKIHLRDGNRDTRLDLTTLLNLYDRVQTLAIRPDIYADKLANAITAGQAHALTPSSANQAVAVYLRTHRN